MSMWRECAGLLPHACFILRSHGSRKCGSVCFGSSKPCSARIHTALSEIANSASFPYSMVWNEAHMLDRKLRVSQLFQLRFATERNASRRRRRTTRNCNRRTVMLLILSLLASLHNSKSLWVSSFVQVPPVAIITKG